MPNHTKLVEDAKEAIKNVFNDRSVDQDTTRESLEELKGEIEILVDTLE